MTVKGPYSRVYLGIADDPRFADVYGDNDALATWLRLLLAAEATYPVPAPLPRGVHEGALAVLVSSGLVEERPGDRYVIHGMEAEREGRSGAAREAGLASARARAQAPAKAPPSTRRQQPVNAGSTPDEQPSNDRPTTARLERGLDREREQLSPPSPSPEDPLDDWYRLTGSVPTSKNIPWVERLAGEHGPDAFREALATEVGIDMDRRTLLSRTEVRLVSRSRAAAKAREEGVKRSRREAEASEKARIEAEMTPEQRAANLARLREGLRERGLLGPGPSDRLPGGPGEEVPEGSRPRPRDGDTGERVTPARTPGLLSTSAAPPGPTSPRRRS